MYAIRKKKPLMRYLLILSSSSRPIRFILNKNYLRHILYYKIKKKCNEIKLLKLIKADHFVVLSFNHQYNSVNEIKMIKLLIS